MSMNSKVPNGRGEKHRGFEGIKSFKVRREEALLLV